MNIREVARLATINQHGIRQTVQHLAALRHVRIAFLAGPLHLKSALAREGLSRSPCWKLGWIFLRNCWLSLEGGIRAFAALAASSKPTTAVVSSNDMTAIGVMREAYQHGSAIPSRSFRCGLR